MSVPMSLRIDKQSHEHTEKSGNKTVGPSRDFHGDDRRRIYSLLALMVADVLHLLSYPVTLSSSKNESLPFPQAKVGGVHMCKILLNIDLPGHTFINDQPKNYITDLTD